jgi:hypothetical protein
MAISLGHLLFQRHFDSANTPITIRELLGPADLVFLRLSWARSYGGTLGIRDSTSRDEILRSTAIVVFDPDM